MSLQDPISPKRGLFYFVVFIAVVFGLQLGWLYHAWLSDLELLLPVFFSDQYGNDVNCFFAKSIEAMSFCLAIRLETGLVALTDTRLVTGHEINRVKKLDPFSMNSGCFFVCASGIRSVYEKTMAYVKETTYGQAGQLYEVVNIFGKMLQKVAMEDQETLQHAGLKWDTHMLIGGQLKGDQKATLFLLYPEGNWMEVSKDQSFAVIGQSKYSLATLKRLLTYQTSIIAAHKAAIVAFEDSAINTSDVDYPIDMLSFKNGQDSFQSYRYQRKDVANLLEQWQSGMTRQWENLPFPGDDDF